VGWNSDYFFLKGIDDLITDGIPEYVLAMFQGKFAIITPALISGALAEGVYFKGYTLFIALWFLFIYCPLCHWVWVRLLFILLLKKQLVSELVKRVKRTGLTGHFTANMGMDLLTRILCDNNKLSY